MLYGVLSIGFKIDVSSNWILPAEKLMGTVIVDCPFVFFRLVCVTVPFTVRE